MVAARPSGAGAGHRPVVLYNGNCPFCRATARWVARLDRRGGIAFLPFQDADAQRFMASIPEDDREASWHLVGTDGTWTSAGTATVQLLGLLPRLAWLGRAIRALRLTWLVGVMYHLVARSRAQLSRLFSDRPGPRRFP